MRETRTLVLTAIVMIVLMLFGKWMRGDFAAEPTSPLPIAVEAERYVVNQNGLALINVNTADAETLALLDGIGETLSERIVAYREEYGDFTSLDELIKVDGIGTKTLETLKKRLICLP